MKIKYRDELGYVIEDVDKYGVSFDKEFAYFNSKKISLKEIELIQEGDESCL